MWTGTCFFIEGANSGDFFYGTSFSASGHHRCDAPFIIFNSIWPTMRTFEKRHIDKQQTVIEISYCYNPYVSCEYFAFRAVKVDASNMATYELKRKLKVAVCDATKAQLFPTAGPIKNSPVSIEITG